MIESSPLPLFQEFRHHLVAIPRRDGTDEMELRRSVDAEEVFREKALAPGFTDSRLFLALPGILTGLGVLGTFIGLQIGMGGLDLRDVENLETSIIPLIQGLVVAFSTSVWGVSSSLTFNIFEKFMGSIANLPIRILQNRVNAMIPRYVPEEAMAEMERASRGTEDILKGLSVAIGNEMQKAIGRLGSEIKDAVAQATSEGQGPLAKKSVELLTNALTAELDKIQKQVAKIEPTVGTLSKTVVIGQQTVTDAVTKLNAHESVVDKMKEAATEIQGAADSFKDFSKQISDASEGHKNAADSVRAVALSGERTAKALEPLPGRFQEMTAALNAAGTSVQHGAESAKQSLQELLTLQEKWFGGAETGLKALRDRVQAIIDAYGNQIEGQTRSLMKEWTHEVNECLKGYRAHVQELTNYMDELQSSISELQKNTNRRSGK